MKQGVDSLGRREGMLLNMSCGLAYLGRGQVRMALPAADACRQGPLKP